ncbi:MAG TPA: efflux RND transporter periplasmic adaptor subunit, partial [Terriglobales bacterium]|nr:efflux RND transporter periplasmic adaptor subunit [Terriglobales bacterium]
MKRIAISFLAVCFCALLVGCSSSQSSTASAASSPSVQTVEVTKVIAKPLDLTVRLPGELQPYESVALFAKVPGFVERISVDRGSRVRSGQEITVISAPELASHRAEAESKAQSAQSQLAGAQAKLAADQSTSDKLQSASLTPGVVAGNDLLLAQKAVEADQAQLKALQENAQAAQQALRAVAETEQYLRIRAPFNGVITERNVHPGALVGPSQSTPMLRIETLDHLRLIVPVPEAYVSAVPERSPVKFSVPDHPNETFTGTVARVSHAVDVKTRTMAVELDVSNPSGQLTPGTFAQVTWPVHRKSPSLLVPTSAIATNLERTFVIRI